MANLNKVMLIGRLTRDPELRYTQGGQPIAKLGLAVNRFYTDKSGAKQEQTTFVDATAFSKQAETINQYLAKGRQIFIEGRLHLNQWETQQGEKRSKLEVIVENFQFLGDRGEGGSGGNSGGGMRQNAASLGGESSPQYGGGPAAPPPSAPDDDLNLDDIPF